LTCKETNLPLKNAQWDKQDFFNHKWFAKAIFYILDARIFWYL